MLEALVLSVSFLEHSTRNESHLCVLYSSVLSCVLLANVSVEWETGGAHEPSSPGDFGSIITILPFSRSGVEWHDRDGCGRYSTSSASQREHGRLWESDGKPGFDGLTHISTSSSSPTAGKWNLNHGLQPSKSQWVYLGLMREKKKRKTKLRTDLE